MGEQASYRQSHRRDLTSRMRILGQILWGWSKKGVIQVQRWKTVTNHLKRVKKMKKCQPQKNIKMRKYKKITRI